jgi:DNA adenine methylase
MKVRAIAPWFGGKRTMAPLVVTELGKHTQYFEPFCVSMAVLFANEPSQKETVNDLHGDLINLARVIQQRQPAETLYEMLCRAVFSEDLLNQARKHLDDESALSIIVSHLEPDNPIAIERAYWYFIASWMGRNGTAGTDRVDYQIAVRWTKGGGSPTVRWFNSLESLPAWHRRLQNVVILRRNAFMILDNFERPSTSTPRMPARREARLRTDEAVATSTSSNMKPTCSEVMITPSLPRSFAGTATPASS